MTYRHLHTAAEHIAHIVSQGRRCALLLNGSHRQPGLFGEKQREMLGHTVGDALRRSYPPKTAERNNADGHPLRFNQRHGPAGRSADFHLTSVGNEPKAFAAYRLDDAL